MKPLSISWLALCFLGSPFFMGTAFSQEKTLVVLDIQELPVKTESLDRSMKEMIKNVNSIIDTFDPENVIYSKAMGQALNISLKGISITPLPPIAFDSTLAIVNDKVFTKIEGDAFTEMEFTSFLGPIDSRKIILVGLMAEECIYKTAIGGIERGYDITIVSDGIIGKTEKKKEKAIKKMKKKGIEFITMEEIDNLLEHP